MMKTILLSLFAALGAERAEARLGGHPPPPIIAKSGQVYNYLHHGSDWTKGRCQTGRLQSPIEFDANDMSQKPSHFFTFRYELLAAPMEIYNSGNSIVMNFLGSGMGGITLEDTWYELMGVSFHSRAEHTLNGYRAPLEVHFIHKKYDGAQMATVALPVTVAQEPAVLAGSAVQTPPPPTFSPTDLRSVMQMTTTPMPTYPMMIPDFQPESVFTPSSTTPPPGDLFHHQWRNQWWFYDWRDSEPLLTKILGPEVSMPGVHQKKIINFNMFDTLDMNPWLRNGQYLHYQGSLTAPPCAEEVTWLVRTRPIIISNAQMMAIYQSIATSTGNHGNYRWPQPRNGRPVRMLNAEYDTPPPKPQGVPKEKPVQRDFWARVNATEATERLQKTVEYMEDWDERLQAGVKAHRDALKPVEPTPDVVTEAANRIGNAIGDATKWLQATTPAPPPIPLVAPAYPVPSPFTGAPPVKIHS